MTAAAPPMPASVAWNVARVRSEFPMLSRQVRGRPLAYLDNAATGLKPQAMIDGMVAYYTQHCGNVARGVHTISQEATARFDEVRGMTARFLKARHAEEIIFTAGTTGAMNLAAQSYGGRVLGPGDEILVSLLEHHSNLVPWQLVAERTGAAVRPIPLTAAGDLDLDGLARALSSRTKIVAVTHVSNVLGTVVPVDRVAELVHRAGGILVVDGAQAVPHFEVDVSALGADFYAFSAHKLFGPTGLGVLYCRGDLLARMGPWQGGGGMIAAVEIERSTYAPPPARFEAGTPPIAEVFGLGAVFEYLTGWDRTAALRYEDELLVEAVTRLSAVEGVRVFGHPSRRVGVVAFDVAGIHPHDVGTALDSIGVAVRAGHHCAQPLMRHLAVSSTVRASFAPYNTSADIDALIEGVRKAQEVFG